MKKHRSLLILTGALAVLVIVYLGLGSYNRKQEQKEAETAEANTVTVTDISDLQEISYQYEGTKRDRSAFRLRSGKPEIHNPFER